MTTRRLSIHTRYFAVFFACALILFLGRELIFWHKYKGMGLRPHVRVLVFLFRKGATPDSVRFALRFGFVTALVFEVLARFALRPLVERWHSPRCDDSDGLFHLAASERVLASSPARRAIGRHWPPGTLVCTNLRLWFFPRAHDAEVWSQPLQSRGRICLEPAPPRVWGLLVGWPDRLTLHDGAEDGRCEVFAVPDPEAVISWFHPGPQSQPQPQPGGDPQASAAPLMTHP
jgi:hypothetical protein